MSTLGDTGHVNLGLPLKGDNQHKAGPDEQKGQSDWAEEHGLSRGWRMTGQQTAALRF